GADGWLQARAMPEPNPNPRQHVALHVPPVVPQLSLSRERRHLPRDPFLVVVSHLLLDRDGLRRRADFLGRVRNFFQERGRILTRTDKCGDCLPNTWCRGYAKGWDGRYWQPKCE